MRVSSNLFQPSSLFLKTGQATIKKNPSAIANAGSRRDQSSISPQGRMVSMIGQIGEQKKAISQRRRDLIGSTLEAGGDMKSIKTQLESYDEQLSQLDEQISQLTADYAKQMADKAVKRDENDEKPHETKTAEQIQTERLTNLATATDKVHQAEAVAAVKGKVEGTADVLEAEIGMSDVEGDTYESKELLSGGASNLKRVISRIRTDMDEKGVEVSELHQLAQDMEMTQAEQLREAAEQAEAGKKDPDAVQENPDAAQKNPDIATKDADASQKEDAASTGEAAQTTAEKT